MKTETKAKLRLWGFINARARQGKYLSLDGLLRLGLGAQDEVSREVSKVLWFDKLTPWKDALVAKGAYYTQKPGYKFSARVTPGQIRATRQTRQLLEGMLYPETGGRS